MKKRNVVFFILFIAAFFVLVDSVSAIAALPDGGKKETGDYNLNDFIRLLLNISDIIFAVVGSLSLLAFVAGGVMFLVSSGNTNLIDRGKKTIIGSVIGMVIVFSSFLIVDFTMKGLGYNENKFGKWNETFADPKVSVKPSLTPPTGAPLNTAGWSFDSGIINQIGDASPELSDLLNCMRSNLPTGVGRVSSISDSHYINNLSTCDNSNTYTTQCDSSGNPPGCCWHSIASCHYGGGQNTGKSYAVDFGDEENTSALVNAARNCDSNVFTLDEGNHLHVSVTACPGN